MFVSNNLRFLLKPRVSEWVTGCFGVVSWLWWFELCSSLSIYIAGSSQAELQAWRKAWLGGSLRPHQISAIEGDVHWKVVEPTCLEYIWEIQVYVYTIVFIPLASSLGLTRVFKCYMYTLRLRRGYHPLHVSTYMCICIHCVYTMHCTQATSLRVVFGLGFLFRLHEHLYTYR